MKIVAISDIHGLLLQHIPECEVLCIAGDISPLKAQRNMPQMLSWLQKRFVPWMNSLPCERVIVVAGNHDFVFENKDFYEAAEDSIKSCPKCVYLNNDTYGYKGKTFYGSPWVVGPAGWAFYDETKKLKMIENTMPGNVDVAIFHQPLEYGNNGRVLQIPSWMVGSTYFSELLKDPNYLHPSYGSAALDEIVKNKAPKLVVTGHVHSGNHEIVNLNDTMVVNVSIIDEDYTEKYKPFEITI